LILAAAHLLVLEQVAVHLMAQSATPPDPQESAWVRACLAGERDAFRPLVERHHGGVLRVAARILGDRIEAQDVAQESFLKAYSALHRYDLERPFVTWLYRIAVNTCLDRRRRRRDVAMPDLEPADGAASADSSLAQHERQVALQRALARLPDDYRTILVLKDIEGLDYESIALILGGSLPALKIRVVRARSKLAVLFKKMYPELALDV